MSADELVGFGADKATAKFSAEWRQMTDEERNAYKATEDLGRIVMGM